MHDDVDNNDEMDETGGVAAEYAAVTAFIAGAVALAVSAFGTRVVALIELL